MEASSRQAENVRLIRESIEAYDRGDLEYVVGRLDPEIEVYTAPGLINAGTYHGIDGFMQWVSQWLEAWETVQTEIVRVDPIGDHLVVAEVEQRGRGAGSGIDVEMRVGYLYELHDGKGTRFHIYRDREAALAAAERCARQPEPAE
jgi:ketosteroid isomerase-like protein